MRPPASERASEQVHDTYPLDAPAQDVGALNLQRRQALLRHQQLQAAGPHIAKQCQDWISCDHVHRRALLGGATPGGQEHTCGRRSNLGSACHLEHCTQSSAGAGHGEADQQTIAVVFISEAWNQYRVRTRRK